jgi:sec-independent protein translocase protein TatA
MFNGSVGPLELLVVLVIVLLIFGPKRLPGLGRQLGKGMREFKDSITGSDKDDDAAKPEVTRAAATTPAATTEDAARESQAAAAEALGGEQRQGGAT